MKKWIAIALGGGGILVMMLALTLGLGHANERLTTDPTDLRDPEHLTVEAPIAEPAPSTTATPAPAHAEPMVLSADTDPASIAYPDTMNVVELENARSWVRAQLITAECMRDRGFDYTFSPIWAGGVTYSWTDRIPEDQWAVASEALDGPKSRFDPAVEYDWSNAGCWGYAVHVMGNDDLH